MALFNIPKRNTLSTQAILKKTQEIQQPKIKLKSGTLINKLASIEAQVEEALGDYHCILLDSDEKWIEYCKKAVEGEYVALDTESTGLNFRDQVEGLVGVCIYSPNQIEAYAPVGHISNITEQLLPHQVSKEAIKLGFDIMIKGGCKFIFHNAYYDIVVLRAVLGYFVKVYWDTLPASVLLNENEPHGLKYLYDKYVMEGSAGIHKFAELFDGIPFCNIKPSVGSKYAAHDSRMCYDLYIFQKPYLTKGTPECDECHLEKVVDLLHNIEIPIITVFADMRWRGICLDFNKAQELHIKYAKLHDDAVVVFNEAVDIVKDKILEYIRVNPNSLLEYPVNYNSPVQLQILFYDILHSGVIFEKEPRGTGKHVINEIVNNPKYRDKPIYNIAKAVFNVKAYDKVLGSFVDKLPEMARYDGKVHCNFHSLGARTGRISSSDPNNQQLPSGFYDVRNMYSPGKGRVMISLDAKKQEVLIAAETAKDENMLDSFRKNLDVYSYLASQIYDVEYKDCLEFNEDGTTNKDGKTRRKHAKAILLGLMYGKGVRAVGEDVNISFEKAQELVDKFFTSFPALKRAIDQTYADLHTKGYVETMDGYRRRLPDALLPKYEVKLPAYLKEDLKASKYYENLYFTKLNNCRGRKEEDCVVAEAKKKGIIIHCNGGKIAKAERECWNARIQGQGSICNKRMMLNIYNNKRLRELGTEIVLTIHDELVITCPVENAYEVCQIAEQCCIDGSSVGFSVPAAFDVAVFDSWNGNEYRFDEYHNLVKLGE